MYVKAMITAMITIIILAVKPADSSSGRMEIKRIKVRQQGRLLDQGRVGAVHQSLSEQGPRL